MTARVAYLVVLAAAAAVLAGLFIAGLGGGPGISDTPVYRIYGERIASGDLPYRDFVVEYPRGLSLRSCWRRSSPRPATATTLRSRR